MGVLRCCNALTYLVDDPARVKLRKSQGNCSATVALRTSQGLADNSVVLEEKSDMQSASQSLSKTRPPWICSAPGVCMSLQPCQQSSVQSWQLQHCCKKCVWGSAAPVQTCICPDQSVRHLLQNPRPADNPKNEASYGIAGVLQSRLEQPCEGHQLPPKNKEVGQRTHAFV